MTSFQRPASWDDYDAKCAEIAATYRERPYVGRDPHGLFPHVLELVREAAPDWSEFRTVLMATAVVGVVHAEYNDSMQMAWKPL